MFPGYNAYNHELTRQIPDAMNDFNLRSVKNKHGGAAAGAQTTELDLELVDMPTSVPHGWAACPSYFGPFLAPGSTTAPVRRSTKPAALTELEQAGMKAAEKTAKNLKFGPGAASVVQQLVFAVLKSQQDARGQEQPRQKRRATPAAGGGE
jgi:hypothetical protein